MSHDIDISKNKRAMIVENHPVLQFGLSKLLENELGLQVCNISDGHTDILKYISSRMPDIVIMDIFLNNTNGLELIKDINKAYPRIPILAYSFHDENIYAMRVLKAGGMGYIMKREPIEKLTKAIKHVLQGRVWLSDELSSRLLQKLGGVKSDKTNEIEYLSDRELEVFEYEGRGYSTSEIANKLSMGYKTVQTYEDNIKKKIGLKNNIMLRYKAIMWVQSEME